MTLYTVIEVFYLYRYKKKIPQSDSVAKLVQINDFSIRIKYFYYFYMLFVLVFLQSYFNYELVA